MQLPDRTVGKNYLTWPVYPPNRVTRTFGELVTEKEPMESAQYVRFEIPQGEFVYASAPAMVYSVLD